MSGTAGVLCGTRMRVRAPVAAVLVLALAACDRAAVGDVPAAGDAPHGDHATSHRRFDDVARWSGVFDDPARDAWQKPAALVAALHLRPGDVVADVGAGTGYLSRYLAAAVGPEGTVFAADPEPNLVEHLRARAEREGTPNVVPVLVSRDHPRLPPRLVDVVLILDTYHHVDGRRAWLGHLAGALRPGGRVVVVDWEKRPLPVGPEMEHKLDRRQVVDEMTASGFTLVEEPPILPYQYVLVFARAGAR